MFQQAAAVKADSIRLPLNKDYTQNISEMIEATNRNARDIGFVYLCNPEQSDRRRDRGQGRQGAAGQHSERHAGVDRRGTTTTSTIRDTTRRSNTSRKPRRVVVARTFSKIAALAAMRIGYNVAPPEMIREMRVYASNSVNVLAKWARWRRCATRRRRPT